MPYLRLFIKEGKFLPILIIISIGEIAIIVLSLYVGLLLFSLVHISFFGHTILVNGKKDRGNFGSREMTFDDESPRPLSNYYNQNFPCVD